MEIELGRLELLEAKVARMEKEIAEMKAARNKQFDEEASKVLKRGLGRG
ncbi:MAG: hypothetical protein M0R06_00765 [Sphaerochaeta sp.]|jgi:hypothetical protein|nr:hypothetical protein [Sphaerochaeta sp.]